MMHGQRGDTARASDPLFSLGVQQLECCGSAAVDVPVAFGLGDGLRPHKKSRAFSMPPGPRRSTSIVPHRDAF
jgi:hypothetical protein